MPGHAGSPYWTAVDFDSEGEADHPANPAQRVYLDPWDTEAYGPVTDPAESSHGETFAGEPISASFYYVPTKYESEDESVAHNLPAPPQVMPPDYYGPRRRSRHSVHEFHPEIGLYECERPVRDRRRASYIEEAMYAHHPLVYESMYGVLPPAMAYPHPRQRVSVHHHPEYAMSLAYGKPRRHSRMAEAYEHFAYESLSPEYEDWARPFPKTAPDNFHLSRYGHLQIDYSCSWNSLDRLIRNQ